MKKYITYFGYVLTFLALMSIGFKVINMEIDAQKFFSKQLVFPFILYFIIQTLLIFGAALPWRAAVEVFSGIKIPLDKTEKIFAKSNVFKYIPGNIFQYVGRNQLAIDMKISHIDVALASVLDVVGNIIAVLLLSSFLLKSLILDLIELFSGQIGILLLIAFILVALLVLVGFLLRKKIKMYIDRYVKELNGKNIAKLLACLGYYILNHVLLLIVYYIIFVNLLPVNIDRRYIFILMGGYIFAWLLGFIMPGAPGGIGIRETVMLFLCAGIADESIIMFFVLAIRVVSIIADIASFVISIFIPVKSRDTVIEGDRI